MENAKHNGSNTLSQSSQAVKCEFSRNQVGRIYSYAGWNEEVFGREVERESYKLVLWGQLAWNMLNSVEPSSKDLKGSYTPISVSARLL